MEIPINSKVMNKASTSRKTPLEDAKLSTSDQDPSDPHVLANKGREGGQEKSMPIVNPGKPRLKDVLSIYENGGKLGELERYLNIIYKPFYCLALTTSKFHLMKLHLALKSTAFEPNKHTALNVYRYSPIRSIKIYPHGNIYCQAFSKSSARSGLTHILRELMFLGYAPRVRRLKTNAVNATFSVPFNLSLMQFHLENPGVTRYDTSKFPFLVYKMMETTVEIAIFPTGYVIVLFSTSMEITKLAIAHTLPILYRFKDPNQDEYKLSLSSGDIDYKLLWENHFQKNGDRTTDW
ncbi:uncharacterized protein LOC6730751 [Drosophila simulans]|uniref:Uncharacterized protein n=2 Tax=Drosophila simulans TaxID=7240 RepID=A0A0J9TE21_DROSI|nr:uncharacterized protein LOC6730751 [Drosophila simulans]KMY87715.1 uncharacterized protein Dsimw501_GD22812 [Drosophila simulans]